MRLPQILRSSSISTHFLTREFIHKALYNHTNGYFTSEAREVVYSPPKPIPFKELWGKMEYKHTLQSLYKAEREAWLTPVEIFAPWYSYAIANYMLASISSQNLPLRIYEVGGGSGANALHIMNYIQEHAPEIYKELQYTLVEVSPRLAERQRHRLSQHRNCRVKCVDMLEWKTKYDVVNEPCFVIAMEVLDNLPHDKVQLKDGEWHETIISHSQDGKQALLTEELRILQDPLIQETMQYFPCELPLEAKYRYNSKLLQRVREAVFQPKQLNAAFIPTGSMQLLKTLKDCFPQHRLIAADFDALPPPTFASDSTYKLMGHASSPTSTSSGPLNAANAPIVASKVSGTTEDHDTYLIEDGIADIFFATDFAKLKHAYCNYIDRERVSVVKSSEFVEAFGDVTQTKTMLGYNPMVEDYTNTSFLLS